MPTMGQGLLPLTLLQRPLDQHLPVVVQAQPLPAPLPVTNLLQLMEVTTQVSINPRVAIVTERTLTRHRRLDVVLHKIPSEDAMVIEEVTTHLQTVMEDVMGDAIVTEAAIRRLVLDMAMIVARDRPMEATDPRMVVTVSDPRRPPRMEATVDIHRVCCFFRTSQLIWQS